MAHTHSTEMGWTGNLKCIAKFPLECFGQFVKGRGYSCY